MAKSISCADAGKDCRWSASAETEEKLLEKVSDHVKAEHKDMELTAQNVSKIRSLIKEA